MFADVVNRGEVPALEKMLAFTEARHRVLTENVANVDTPGYVTRELDPAAFQQALRRAVTSSRQAGGELRIEGSDQFHEDASGHLVVTPTTQPAENVLFHDGTNGRIERQMAMLAENAMMHQTITELLRGRFEQMTSAIRGTVR
jgi:flagellar basal-body rod protein FlgB